MKVRSKAPLRLGIAGGGTDVSPYCDIYGGCVLNATINMYAYTHIDDEVDDYTLILESKDLEKNEVIDLNKDFDINDGLILHKAIYRRIMRDFNNGNYIPMRITTFIDAPPGSGLGSSSTLVVSIIEAMKTLLGLPLGEYDVAHLAYEIERNDCNLSGGKQDQYAATFGGFNFMEFYEDRVIVNPLRIRNHIISELESSLLLYFTGQSRDSAKIIDEQVKSVGSVNNKSSLEGMHKVKQSAYKMKELLFKYDIEGICEEFKSAWLAKKSTSSSITNPTIDKIESAILSSGAKSMKVSGAGGGGFIMIFIEPEKRLEIEGVLSQFNGHVEKFQFTSTGATSWIV